MTLLSYSQTPTVRQRSYSVPSSNYFEEPKMSQPKMSLPSHSLDEALALLSKKKLAKTDIDEQSLLHRAANAGKSRMIKPQLRSGGYVIKLVQVVFFQ